MEMDSRLSYPRLCGLLGANPSRLSQAMHNAGFKALGLPYFYVAFRTTDTAAGLRAMRELGLRGLSLTIPHKEAAIGLVDRLSPEVQQIKAINTVVNDDGFLSGYNTDWYGAAEALREVQADWSGKSALLLGAGGASRGALYALRSLGIALVRVVNRTSARAEKLADEFKVQALVWDEGREAAAEADLIINSTPLGLPLAGSGGGYPFSIDSLKPQQVVFDMVTRETPLLEAARRCGAHPVAGTRMLLFQALRQFELFTGKPAPRDDMEQALLGAASREG